MLGGGYFSRSRRRATSLSKLFRCFGGRGPQNDGKFLSGRVIYRDYFIRVHTHHVGWGNTQGWKDTCHVLRALVPEGGTHGSTLSSKACKEWEGWSTQEVQRRQGEKESGAHRPRKCRKEDGRQVGTVDTEGSEHKRGTYFTCPHGRTWGGAPRA